MRRQFNLRSLLLIVIVSSCVAIVYRWRIEADEREKKALALISAHDGHIGVNDSKLETVRVDFWKPITKKTATSGDFRFGKQTIDPAPQKPKLPELPANVLAGLQHIRRLERVGIHDKSLPKGGMEHLAKCSDLRELALACDALSEEDLAILESISRLRVLDLDGEGISDEAKKRLQTSLQNCNIQFW